MENNNVVMFLLVIIVVLAAVFGIMFFQSLNSKEPSKVKIISNKTQYEGGKLAIQLTDLNKTPISKEKINIVITNKKDKVVANNTVETNDDGKAKLDLNLKKGEYSVNVTFEGNKNYTGNNTTQKLTIKEKVAEAVSSGGSSGGDYLDGPAVDSLGITKEQARHAEQVSGYDVKYDYKSGMYVQYDPYNHCYHN